MQNDYCFDDTCTYCFTDYYSAPASIIGELDMCELAWCTRCSYTNRSNTSSVFVEKGIPGIQLHTGTYYRQPMVFTYQYTPYINYGYCPVMDVLLSDFFGTSCYDYKTWLPYYASLPAKNNGYSMSFPHLLLNKPVRFLSAAFELWSIIKDYNYGLCHYSLSKKIVEYNAFNRTKITDDLPLILTDDEIKELYYLLN